MWIQTRSNNLQFSYYTYAEYLEFFLADGYKNPKYWLSDGWHHVLEEKWQAPLYWEFIDKEWWTMTLSGMQKVAWEEPVCHISYYEADAYARWTNARLPTEAEFDFLPFESIRFEHSFKYSLPQIERLAVDNGFEVVKNFMDSKHYFVDSLWRVKKKWFF